MEDMNEKLEKTLHKNYAKVQKKELEVSETTEILAKNFASEVALLAKQLKQESTAHKGSDKDIKSKYKDELGTIKESHQSQLDSITSEISIQESKYQKELVDIKEAHSADSEKINKEISKVNKEFQKQLDLLKKQNDKDLSLNQVEMEQAKEKATLEIKELEAKFSVEKERYDGIVASLNAEKNEKIDKLSESLNKKVEALTQEIQNEENKIATKLEESVPKYQKGLEAIEKGIDFEQDQYDTKLVAMRSTLESKIARHEKFMNKNIKDNDQRAAKQHRKEIIALQKNGEKELKLLAIEFEEKTKDTVLKRKAYIKENFEKINLLSKKIVEYREERLFKISTTKAEAYSEIEDIKFEYSKLLLEEQHKFDEIIRDHSNKLAELNRKHSLMFEGINHARNLLNLQFDKAKKIVDQNNFIELSYKKKELTRNELQIESKNDNAKLELNLAIAELESNAKFAKMKLIHDIELNKRNELMEQYNIDLNRQVSVNKNQLAYQGKVRELFESRAKLLFEYDDLEVNNRFDLKIKFIRDQIEVLSKDKDKIIQKIEETFKDEQELYVNQKMKISTELQAELTDFETNAIKELDSLVAKRDALDPKEFKKEAKEFERVITEKREELRLGLETRKNAISLKTSLFDIGLAQVNSKREKSLADYDAFFNIELGKLQSEIEYLQDTRDQEIADCKGRYAKTNEAAQDYYNQASKTCDNAINESKEFLQARVQSENKFIENAENLIRKQETELKLQLKEYIENMQLDKQNSEEKLNEKIRIADQELAAKVDSAKVLLDNAELEYEALVEKQVEIFDKKNADIERDFSVELSRISTQFTEKESLKRSKILDIERLIANQARNLENLKKTLKRDFEIALSKELSALDQRLAQDLKTI
ncbi:MAG: hypothetical protein JXR62_04820 [Bacilli bacterium]|nr:hypothetical protein [Bacilli bacterium]